MLPESPYTSYLDTDHVPSHEQATQIQTFLSSPAIVAEGQRITDELARLSKVKAEYDAFMRRHKGLSSRMRRLPLDIWQIIFGFCLPTRSYPSMSPFEMPAVLTRVCKSWREIALATPELWSKLYIPLPSYPREPTSPRNMVTDELDDDSLLDVLDANEASYDQALKYWETRMDQRRRMLELWLSRAGKRPLCLNILDYSGLSFNYGRRMTAADALPTFARPMKDLIDVLQRHSEQWGQIEMKASYPFIHTLFMAPAPNLTSLRINNSASEVEDILRGEMYLVSDYRSVEPTLAEHIRIFRTLFPMNGIKFPSLKTLFLKNLHEDIVNLPVNWNNITELFFDKYTLTPGMAFGPREATTLLRKCPRMQKCHLVLRRLPVQILPIEPPPLLLLGDLHHFSIHESTKSRLVGTCEFFQCLVTPSLRTLIFTTNVPPSIDPAHIPQPIFPLLEAHGSGIRTLGIDYRSWTIHELERLLPLVNDNLENLWFNVGLKGTDPNDRFSRRWQSLGDLEPEMVEKRALLTDAFMRDFLVPDLARLDDIVATNSGKGTDMLKTICTTNTSLSRKLPKLKMFHCHLQSTEFSEDVLLDFVRARRSRRALETGLIDNYIEKVVVRFAMHRPMENMDERLAEFASRHEKQLGLGSSSSLSSASPTSANSNGLKDIGKNLAIKLPSWEDYCDMEEKRNPGVFAPLFNDPDLDLGPSLVTFTRPYEDDFLFDDEFGGDETVVEETAVLTKEAESNDEIDSDTSVIASTAPKLILDVTWPADYISLSMPHVRPVSSHGSRSLGWARPIKDGPRERIDYGTWSPSWRMTRALDCDMMSNNARRTITGVVLF
ncbi:hypothetical protein BKA70DRAFT_1246738 [Coprinopsis sp. MPI-PUGE-AT-0042]|nr:hypothetical protein BKA70DRAFT_1246738 [Coprinopsis sp. MPI-PUGE-AT-0042]